MSSSKSVFFLLAVGPPLLFLSVLLELSSLIERSSGATEYYLAELSPIPVAVQSPSNTGSGNSSNPAVKK
jgi:hypothetical protein